MSSSRFDNITRKIVIKENKQLDNEAQAKRNEVWSKLANQIVGAEKLKD